MAIFTHISSGHAPTSFVSPSGVSCGWIRSSDEENIAVNAGYVEWTLVNRDKVVAADKWQFAGTVAYKYGMIVRAFRKLVDLLVIFWWRSHDR
ncbi:hypothetical protein F442_12559 [Phytophthora nicotianae P10297]|uniref:Uncharacterized protein n=1 Tax=Phytophthora nicotianae P10297 TaxID=1317064 RepID=W2YYE0_PHYNI|nr:hypothetical protein F442_12559 [Phytophthora nicotianae P10297]